MEREELVEAIEKAGERFLQLHPDDDYIDRCAAAAVMAFADALKKELVR